MPRPCPWKKLGKDRATETLAVSLVNIWRLSEAFDASSTHWRNVGLTAIFSQKHYYHECDLRSWHLYPNSGSLRGGRKQGWGRWNKTHKGKSRGMNIYFSKSSMDSFFLRRQMINWKVAQTASKFFQIIITGPLSRGTKQHSNVEKNWQELPHFLCQNSYSHFVNAVFGLIH